MIVLNIDETNTIKNNVGKYATLPTPYYLFYFYDNDNNDKWFYSKDISETTDYNEFNIIISGSSENLSGDTPTVNWLYNEKTRYKIFQCKRLADYNENDCDALNLRNDFDKDVDFLETGFVWINNVENENDITIYTAGDEDKKIVYRG